MEFQISLSSATPISDAKQKAQDLQVLNHPKVKEFFAYHPRRIHGLNGATLYMSGHHPRALSVEHIAGGKIQVIITDTNRNAKVVDSSLEGALEKVFAKKMGKAIDPMRHILLDDSRPENDAMDYWNLWK